MENGREYLSSRALASSRCFFIFSFTVFDLDQLRAALVERVRYSRHTWKVMCLSFDTSFKR